MPRGRNPGAQRKAELRDNEFGREVEHVCRGLSPRAILLDEPGKGKTGPGFANSRRLDSIVVKKCLPEFCKDGDAETITSPLIAGWRLPA